jgi:pimeloyl-ACP methyl ester carboxylesterase
MAAPRTPPPLKALAEGLTGLELARLALTWPRLARLPRGRGRPALVCPGYSGDDTSTLALRAMLRGLGHDARGWGLGRNVRDVPETIDELTGRVRDAADAAGDRLALVGWSLGGYLAREVARAAPEAVRSVVTLGSPIIGGPKYTQLAPLYRARGFDLDWIEREVRAREAAAPIRVPVTVVYSRLDGIVSWQACIDDREAMAENVEITATHFGLGFSVDAWRIVAERLARPDPGSRAPSP